MHRKPATVQFLKCKTLNCANSYKSVSSLRRHNKSCIDFIQVYCIADDPIQIFSAGRFSGSVAAAGDVGDEEDSSYSLEKAIEDNRNTIRDAACLCDPDDYEAHVTVSEDLRTQSETYGEAETATVHGQDDLSAKNRKEVILNPAGEFDPEKCFYLEDLIIDESQVKRLESYSWYGGVPQRDKAGRINENIIIASPNSLFKKTKVNSVTSASIFRDSPITAMKNDRGGLLEKLYQGLSCEFDCLHIPHTLHDHVSKFAGQFFVWVHSDGVQGPTLHRVSQHARLYAQLLGRISSATKRMDARIVYLANSILKEGHSKNSFNFKGLIKWSFIEKLQLTESKEAMKLIQSLRGSASNRMRVIVGTYDFSFIEIEWVLAVQNK